MKNSFSLIPSILLALICAATVHAAEPTDYASAFPINPDPFTGNWAGIWDDEEKNEPDIAAQIIPLGANKFRIIVKCKHDMRCKPDLVVEETAQGDTLEFSVGAFFGKIKGDRFTGGKTGTNELFSMSRAELASPTLNAKPPRRATILFDGTSMSAWRDTPGWDITPAGTLLVTPDAEDLVSVARFQDMQLHLEFRLPYTPDEFAQERGNSGIFLQNAYELQILDSFGLEGHWDECGALYKIAAPRVNACRPPLQWQTYDITYTAPRFSRDGELKALARLTVLHNGVPIHTDLKIPHRTGGKDRRARPQPSQPQSLKIQEHHDFIEFQNIWIVEPK